MAKVKKLGLGKLREMIEEIAGLSEGVDHVAMKDIVTSAQKLLAAVESFKDTAPQSALGAVTPHIDAIEKALEDMLSTPASYVDKKATYKKVSLKPVNS